MQSEKAAAPWVLVSYLKFSIKRMGAYDQFVDQHLLIKMSQSLDANHTNSLTKADPMSGVNALGLRYDSRLGQAHFKGVSG